MQTRTKITLWMVVLLLVGGTLLGACGGGTPSLQPAAPTVAPATVASDTDAPAAPTESAPPTEATSVIDAAALLQERCVDCHSLNRTTSARHTQAEWQEIVTRMIKHGAVLNPDEEAALVAYLAETYKP